MTQKDNGEHNKNPSARIGIRIAVIMTVILVVLYYFYGKKFFRNRRKIKLLTKKLFKSIREKVKGIQKINKRVYYNLIDE